MKLTFEQLPDAVSRLFDKMEDIERLLQIKYKNTVPASDDLLIIQQAAEFLHISRHTVYGLASRRKIPHMKKGKRLYFSKKDLTEWIAEGRTMRVS